MSVMQQLPGNLNSIRLREVQSFIMESQMLPGFRQVFSENSCEFPRKYKLRTHWRLTRAGHSPFLKRLPAFLTVRVIYGFVLTTQRWAVFYLFVSHVFYLLRFFYFIQMVSCNQILFSFIIYGKLTIIYLFFFVFRREY